MGLKTYHNCSDLPIYNFAKIVNDNDYRYLLKDFNEFESQDAELAPMEVVELSILFKEFYYEYAELTKNIKLMKSLRKELSIDTMEAELTVYENVYNIVVVTGAHKMLLLLNDLGFDYDESKTYNRELNRLKMKIKGLRNKIKIKKSNYTKENEQKSDAKMDVERDAILLSMSLQLGHQINVRKTSVRAFQKYIDINNQKVSNGK